ncbi:RNA methyltransferase, partial [Methyloceanibacter sp.]|uniref:RNA methyltransferase n=1 Tax=Methyloceanibacter sp. TaxID=1965321 RepID=UPI003D6D1970
MMKARAEAGGRAKPKARATPKSRAKTEPSSVAPAVILIAPQLGENIGFAARAMANFGLTELRLVAPRDGWPNDKARAAAAGADSIVDRAKVYPSLAAAIGDLTFLLATTARPRGMVKPVLTPQGAARELAARGGKGERTGVMFGPERSGLDNDAISLADAIVTAPVNPSFASLSLPQTVLLVGYEWLQARGSEPSLGRATKCDGPAAEGLDLGATRAATRAELLALFEHLESELDRCGFLRPPEKRPTMVRAIRNMFH